MLREALEREDSLEDDRGGRLDAETAMLDAVEVEDGTGRVVRMVLHEVPREDVGVQEGECGHLPLR
jgi:hypothetical protein